MNILLDLEDDYGADGLTEAWTKVEWVCRQNHEKRSATKRPARGGEDRMVREYALPPEESSMRNDLEEYDL